MDRNLSDIESILRDIFGDKNLTVKLDTTAADVEGWDSLMNVRIILEIERAFAIQFKASDVTNFKNVGDILEALNSQT